MSYTFTKMHGLGNDFVIFDAVRQDIQLSAKLIQRISDRRTGIGCDQVLRILPAVSDQADITLEIFNADGSPAGACGNGTRCIAWMQAQNMNKPDIRSDLEEWLQLPWHRHQKLRTELTVTTQHSLARRRDSYSSANVP